MLKKCIQCNSKYTEITIVIHRNTYKYIIIIKITNFNNFCLQKQLTIKALPHNRAHVHVTIEQRFGIAKAERVSISTLHFKFHLKIINYSSL